MAGRHKGESCSIVSSGACSLLSMASVLANGLADEGNTDMVGCVQRQSGSIGRVDPVPTANHA